MYNVAFYIAFLTHLLDVLQLANVSLVGLSLGGAIALGFTLQEPNRVNRLVLVDPYGIMPHVAWHKLSYLYVKTPLNELSYRLLKRSRSMSRWSLRSNLISDPDRISDHLVEQLLQALHEPGAGKAFASFQRYELRWNGLSTNYTDRLHEITAPTLFVHGENDRGVPLNYAKQAHELVKGSQVYVMANCLHWPMRDRPEEFNRVVADFLRDQKILQT